MTTDSIESMTHRNDRNRPPAVLTHWGEGLCVGAFYIAVGGDTGPRAEVFEDAGRWRVILVDCHRDLEITFLNLSDAVRVAETLVETAITTAALAYDADPVLMEASA